MLKNLFYILILLGAVGCNPINPSRMFKTKKDFQYSATPPDTVKAYRLAPGDIIEFRIFTNDGFKLIDLTTLNENANPNAALRTSLDYIIQLDGFVKLPILGRVYIVGNTIRQAELLLEEKYSTYYNKPFVLLKVESRRVLVFPGTGGSGKVVPLVHENTSLIEALALAGGIANTGRAKKIKLIRGDSKNPQVFLIDLSTIEGMKQANLSLQANDIIYVEPVPRILQAVASELSPVLTIATTILFLYTLVDRLNN